MRAPSFRHARTLAVVVAGVIAGPTLLATAAADAPAEAPSSGATIASRTAPLAAPAPEPQPDRAADPDAADAGPDAGDTGPDAGDDAGDDAADAPEPAPATEPTPAPEAYPPREPQTSCEVVDHGGIERFRDVVLAAHPGTGDGGIVRDCGAGGSSEHKEGRAWDWMLDAHDPADAAAADEVLGWLLATDETGEPHALARRLGVLYVIWDGRIWSASRAGEGWRPYGGASPHTDHVHLSFSTEGARGDTSFFDPVWEPAVGEPFPTEVEVTDGYA